MTSAAMRTFLRFLYAGDLVTDLMVPDAAMYLMEAATFYGLTNQRLRHLCEACVMSAFNEEQVLQLFDAAWSLDVEPVKTLALDFIIAHFDRVGKHAALERLERPQLVAIIKSLSDRPTAK